MQPNVRANQNRMYAERSMPLKRMRFLLVCLFFLGWAGVICGRLFWLQIVRHDEFVARAKKQQQTTLEVLPRRGVLYDRNLRELAMTVQVDSIYAAPADIGDKPAVASELAAIVHTDPDDTQTTEEQIAARLGSSHSSIRVARGVSAEASARVMALGLKGIYVQKEFEVCWMMSWCLMSLLYSMMLSGKLKSNRFHE